MRSTGLFLVVLGALACSAMTVGGMDPVEGGKCSKTGVTVTSADGCETCKCDASGVWDCNQACSSSGAGGTSSATAAGTGATGMSMAGVPATAGTESSVGAKGGVDSVSGTPITTPMTGACTREGKATPPSPPKAGATHRPCDIYAEDGGPCVAAHSTVRALYASYDGPLYQVRNASGETLEVVTSEPGGFADATAQVAFCALEGCTISMVYDQSGMTNHLTRSPAGGAKSTPNNEAIANAAPVTLGGHDVYGVHIVPGVGYRNNDACGTAIGDGAETIYMVVAGQFHNGGCCFDYGNMERNSRDNGEGAVEAVYFGSCAIWGKGADNGPWVMGDLENGLWAGDVSPYSANKPVSWNFVTGMVKGDGPGKNHWTIKAGDAQNGPLIAPFDGQRPSERYRPMRKEGAVGLGTGGDNSSAGRGDFFEGVMTAHYASNAADDAVHADVVSVYATAQR